MIDKSEFDFDLLSSKAKEIVEEKTSNSIIFDPDAEAGMPRFDTNELELGNLLGEGGFCAVHEIQKILLRDGTSQQHITEEDEDEYGGFVNGHVVQDRNFIASRYRRGNDARYAIKKIKREIYDDPDHYVAGVMDLAIEARFLAVIRHPNIIKMRATARISPYQVGYFVVLDRLYDTLTVRLKSWKSYRKKICGVSKIRDLGGNKKKSLWITRLLVGYDIAAALRYLHEQRIIYRDLKPDNIGFDVRGDVKIFDFGLAREVDDDLILDDVYSLSGNTGSLRYMAPEVAKSLPYNFSVDVYSFAILLWYICALEMPFPFYDIETFTQRVVNGGERPKIDPKWSPYLIHLFDKCWSEDHRQRFDFQQVTDTLRNEISMIRGENSSVLDVSSRTDNSTT